jgi:hypothetical protein
VLPNLSALKCGVANSVKVLPKLHADTQGGALPKFWTEVEFCTEAHRRGATEILTEAEFYIEAHRLGATHSTCLFWRSLYKIIGNLVKVLQRLATQSATK